jgi:hypothetical protein
VPWCRFLSWLFLGLGWRCDQEAADDLGGRLQDQEEQPQQEGANLADHKLAIHSKLQRQQSGWQDQPTRVTNQSIISSDESEQNQRKLSFQEQQLFSFRWRFLGK